MGERSWDRGRVEGAGDLVARLGHGIYHKEAKREARWRR